MAAPRDQDLAPAVAAVGITGGSGLIGRALTDSLRRDGIRVVHLVRRPASGPAEIEWHPERTELDPATLIGLDAVVHLAGAGINDRRWSAAYKQTLRDSRTQGTHTVACALAQALPHGGPPTLLSASAIGYYGDGGDRVFTESDVAGAGFLADLCREWENHTAPASEAGVRVVTLRTGLVLSRSGGLLGKLRPLFKAGLGGRLGSGEQWMSWIALPDQVAAIRYLISHHDVAGPVNLTAPNPVRNTEFTHALARAVHRPAIIPVPALALRLVLGELADEGALSSAHVTPGVLGRTGFVFGYPALDTALAWATNR